jgi:hypothetical protein
LPKYTQNSDPTFYLAFTGNGNWLNWESLKVLKTKTKLKQREQNSKTMKTKRIKEIVRNNETEKS